MGAGFTAKRPSRLPFLGSIQSGIPCAAIQISKNSARKSSHERQSFFAELTRCNGPKIVIAYGSHRMVADPRNIEDELRHHIAGLRFPPTRGREFARLVFWNAALVYLKRNL